QHLDIDSGNPETEYFKDWGICAQIYNEVLGLLTFECPEKLRSLSLMYGSMVNRREGCEAAVFAIALQNGAMRFSTIPEILEYAFSIMDQNTLCYQELVKARDIALNCNDWREARKSFLNGLPKHGISDAIPNSGLIVIALLFGEGDFSKTMSLSMMLGYDTDCTACTVGGIMGALVGEQAIPSSWKDLLGGVMTNIIWDKWEGCHLYDKYAWNLPEKITIKELAEKTLTAARIVKDTL
ncbi:MAG TPA: ADP-ribosylglycohydrolase family protein, partial [Ruminiclostridium sp.]